MTIREQKLCATENGVVGRFQQNIGQVMTCVGMDVGMNLRFGDWHGSRHTKPDITIWDGNNQAIVAGELKTPWKTTLRRTMETEDPTSRVWGDGFTRSAGKCYSSLTGRFVLRRTV